MWNALNTFELQILDFIQDTFKCAFLDVFMKTVTLFGEDGIFFIAMAVIMLFFKKTRKTGLMIGVIIVCLWVVQVLLIYHHWYLN